MIRMPKQLTIRKAIPGDEASSHEAHMRSIREICVKDHGEEEIKGWGYRELGNRWIRPIKEDFVWVVESESTMYGFAYIRMIQESSTKRSHLHGLYLTPEAAGQGIATQMMELMLNAAKDFKAEIVTLESSITGHDFYKRFGFKDVGSMLKVDIGGYPVSCFPMELNLSK